MNAPTTGEHGFDGSGSSVLKCPGELSKSEEEDHNANMLHRKVVEMDINMASFTW